MNTTVITHTPNTPADTGTGARQDLPRIVKPSPTRSIPAFAQEAGNAMRHQRQWFSHHGEAVVIDQSVRGELSRPLGFRRMTPIRAITALEAFIRPGLMRHDRPTGREEFMGRSLTRAEATRLLKAPEFITQLPRVARILDVPVPVALPDGSIVMPERGYDPHLETYCDPEAPEPERGMPLNKALALLEDVHTDFLWRDDRSRVHALARMITPWCRGLMGWPARTPLWFFSGPMGKDYLASLTEALYQGTHACHFTLDLRNAIGGAIRSGQRRLHMTDSYARLNPRLLTEAVSSPVFTFKEGSRDVVLPNELELGLSHVSYAMALKGLAPVVRLIQLTNTFEYNQRKFKHPRLRENLVKNRGAVLGAVAALVAHWMDKGCPAGPHTLPGFPEWSRVVGGVLHANGLGDPCLPTAA